VRRALDHRARLGVLDRERRRHREQQRRHAHAPTNVTATVTPGGNMVSISWSAVVRPTAGR
jgi:hypothetical protein